MAYGSAQIKFTGTYPSSATIDGHTISQGSIAGATYYSRLGTTDVSIRNILAAIANNKSIMSATHLPQADGYECTGFNIYVTQNLYSTGFQSVSFVLGSINDSNVYYIEVVWKKSTTVTPTPTTMTVTFNANGGSVSQGTKTVTKGSTYGTLPTPTRSGYLFNGWYLSTSGGTEITSSTTVTATANHTLYARWASSTLKVTFNPNGGTVSTSSKNVTYNSTYGTLPTPTRSGYSFKGWFTATSGGYLISSSSPVTTLSDHTLFAQWDDAKVTFTFKMNNGTDTVYTTRQYTKGGTYDSLPSAPTRTGYRFDGWFYSTGTSTQLVVGGSVGQNSRTVYAHWTSTTVTTPVVLDLYFSANLGSFTTTPASHKVTVGQQYGNVFPANGTVKRDGYTFNGWWTGSSAGVEIKSTSIVAIASAGATSITLYAHWTPNASITVTINPDNGSGTQKATTTAGSKVSLPTNLKKTGYTLAQWVIVETGETISKTATAFNPTITCTIKAQWTPKTPKVQFNLNGGSGTAPSSVTATVGQKYPTLPNPPAQTSSTFSGWYTAAKDGDKVTGGSTVVPATDDSTITLYAHWATKTGSVVLSAGTDGKFSDGKPSRTKTGNAGSSVTITSEDYPIPNDSSKQFAGWKNSSGQTYSKSTSSFSIPATGGSVTYTAYYTAKSTTTPTTIYVTYDAQGGSVSPAGKTYNSTDTYGTLPTPSRTDYTFGGWYSGTNGSGVKIQSTTKVSYTIIYAKWTKNATVTTPAQCQVTYNANNKTFSPSLSGPKVDSGTKITLPSATASDGSTLKNWQISGSSTTKNAGDSYTVTSNVTFIAQWNTTVVTPNAPTWITGSQTVYKGNSLTLKWNAVSGATDYVLYRGSTTLSTQTGTTYTETYNTNGTYSYKVYARNGTTLSPASTTIQIKVEDPPAVTQYTLTYNANGATSGTAPQGGSYGYGAKITIPDVILKKVVGNKTYILAGWHTNSAATTPLYKPNESFYLYGPTTLYAVWTEDYQYAVVQFDPGEGSVSSTSLRYLIGHAFNDAANPNPNFPVPSKPYPPSEYTFNGWYSAASGGSKVTESAICTGSRVLYAQWTRTAPNAPTWTTLNPTSVKQGAGLNLNWSYVTSAVNYQIRFDGGTPITVSTNSYSYTAPAGFLGGYAEVRAVNSNGQYSNWSTQLNINLDRGFAPSAPAECYINRNVTPPTIFTNDPNQDTYDVSWLRSTDVDGDLVGYNIYRRTESSGNWSSWTKHVTTSDPSILHLTEQSRSLYGCTAVQFYVVAYDKMGNTSEPTYSNTVTVSAKVPPTAPPTLIVPDQSYLPLDQRNGIIWATEEFRISWQPSTDADGDLVGYRIQEKRDDEEWGNDMLVPATSANYINAVIPRGPKKVQYRIQAYDSLDLASGWTYSLVATVINNTPPSAPKNLQVPNPVKGGESFLISWEPSTDNENNLEGYIVERMLDGGSWTVIGETTSPSFADKITKSLTEQHDTVAYRIKAYDEYGATSAYLNMDKNRPVNVSNNASPVVKSDWSNGSYLGVFEHGFSFPIYVTDEEGDNVDVTVGICPVGSSLATGTKILQEYKNVKTAPDGFSTLYTLEEDYFTSLPMERFYLVITANDLEGEGMLLLEFTRKGTRAFLTLKEPMAYPEFISQVAFTRLNGSFPSDCIMKVEVTNNANDRAGAVRWEDCTAEARALEIYQFQNKMSYTPAFNFRITLNRGPSGAGGYLSRVSGYFITADDLQTNF